MRSSEEMVSQIEMSDWSNYLFLRSGAWGEVTHWGVISTYD